MAIYKGRSVQIISTDPITEPDITIVHKDGQASRVKPSELLFTKIELDKISKDNAKVNYRLIEDKDHKELLDGQDPMVQEKKFQTEMSKK